MVSHQFSGLIKIFQLLICLSEYHCLEFIVKSLYTMCLWQIGYHHFFGIRESSFNMTRGDEDIEEEGGGLLKN